MKQFKQTRFTITINMDLKSLKKAYRKHFTETGKITKADVANWLAALVEADVLSVDEPEE